jgi:hypothetical protein
MGVRVATQVERIASMEVRITQLENKVDDMNSKLDELLALRYKGVGAFWVASSLIGTGIVGFVVQVLNWLRG